jgi:ADP-heptose:LPS heptosyltransferase
LVSQTSIAHRTLVVFPGALGDFVCFLPALRRLRDASGNRLTLVCKSELRGLARLDGVAETIALEGREASWLFSGEPPLEAHEFFGSFAVVHSFTGAKIPEVERNLARWVGKNGKASPFRACDRVHAAAHFLRCVGFVGETVPRIRLEIPLALRAELRARRGTAMNNRPLLLVHPGSGGDSKRWSRAGFRAVIANWQREHGAAAVLLGPAERGEASDWSSTPAIVPEDPVELAAILAEADAYLGNDSGPSHLAGAVGARGTVVFGPSDVESWRPLGGGLEPVSPKPWSQLDQVSSSEENSLVWQALTRAARVALP